MQASLNEDIKSKLNEITKNYILENKEKYKIKNINDINISYERLEGGMNQNYKISIKDNDNNITHYFLIRLIQTNFNETFDRQLEVDIIEKLAEKYYGPKLLFFDLDKQTYRIDEFIEDSKPISYNNILNENFISQIILMLNEYIKIGDLYKYEIQNEKINIAELTNASKLKINLNNNIYNKIIDNLIPKAIEHLSKFKNDYNYYIKNNIKISSKFNENSLQKLEYYLKNCKNLLVTLIKSEGFFVLNHGDFYRMNILFQKKTNKLFIIDNEMALLNLIGYDIMWYLNLVCFDYFPEYKFLPKALNHEIFYKIYKKFIEIFIKNYENIEDEKFKKYLEILNTEKYYLSVLVLCNLFSIIICIIDIDFKGEFVEENSIPFYQNILNNVELFEINYEAYSKL